ncbi:33359_t:CDS:1, partial [Racocetra persica]
GEIHRFDTFTNAYVVEIANIINIALEEKKLYMIDVTFPLHINKKLSHGSSQLILNL